MSAALITPLAGAAAAAASLPVRVGPYTIVGKLGEGTMGVVYSAHDPRLARMVAVKTLRPQSPGPSTAALRRFKHEAQAAARLSHPGIVAIHEYGEDDGQAFIAMEQIAGTPLLAATSRAEGLAENDVLCIMVQLLSALQCAHEQGVWHRDIKPANLIVTRDGRLKIADFGIARIDADTAATHETGAAGTPGYMAPECYAGNGIDHRADLYACGVLLYELLAGARPYRGSPQAVKEQTLHAPVPELPAPSVFASVVRRALAKQASARHASAAEMRLALMAAAARPVANALSAQAMRLLCLTPVADTPSASPPPTAAMAPPVIDAVARLLAEDLGPLAQCLARRAAVRSDSAHGFLVRLAQDALPEARRQRFIERARAVVPGAIGPDAGAVRLPPLLGETPLEPCLIDAARALLAQQVGPLAAVLVQRAARTSATREQFIDSLLAALVAEPDERERLAATLCRLR
jgi:eukaryotic-like serine/threonine-protein kinase